MRMRSWWNLAKPRRNEHCRCKNQVKMRHAGIWLIYLTFLCIYLHHEFSSYLWPNKAIIDSSESSSHTLTVLSSEPETKDLESVKKVTQRPRSVDRQVALFKSHTLTVLSGDAPVEAIFEPSGEKAMQLTWPLPKSKKLSTSTCCVPYCIYRQVSCTSSGWIKVLSTITRKFVFVLNFDNFVSNLLYQCPRRIDRQVPLATLHTRTQSSEDEEAIVVPSGEKAKPRTTSLAKFEKC